MVLGSEVPTDDQGESQGQGWPEGRPEPQPPQTPGGSQEHGEGSGREVVEVIAGIYARKSTEDTRSKEEGKSTARQIENATAYATEHDWIVDPELIFIDENISGGE